MAIKTRRVEARSVGLVTSDDFHAFGKKRREIISSLMGQILQLNDDNMGSDLPGFQVLNLVEDWRKKINELGLNTADRKRLNKIFMNISRDKGDIKRLLQKVLTLKLGVKVDFSRLPDLPKELQDWFKGQSENLSRRVIL
ncbi:MAG: hypothetical protein ABIJ26_00180 [Candidatus Margulisiibacteriota bacterium]